MFCFPIIEVQVLDPLSFYKLHVDMHMNKAKFEETVL